MRLRLITASLLSAAVAVLAGAAYLTPPKAAAADTACRDAPPMCDRDGCPPGFMSEQGNAVDPATGRRYFLDYPCDLKPGEKVIFILSIHGASASGAWQREYFPAAKYKDKYRLVIATPTAATADPVRMWMPDADDQHLQNITRSVFDKFGRENIKAFWLAGHSQGGMTSNRIVCTPFFRDKVDGWLSLSGGRIGAVQLPADFFGPDGPPAAITSGDPNAPRPGFAQAPDCDFNYIFETGEREITALPDASPWAQKYGCGPRERQSNIVDLDPGFVTGARPGRPASWGREARPGRAEEYIYPNCRDGRLVADVMRLDKGHTEGLEPRITEELIRLVAAAPGGKAAGATG